MSKFTTEVIIIRVIMLISIHITGRTIFNMISTKKSGMLNNIFNLTVSVKRKDLTNRVDSTSNLRFILYRKNIPARLKRLCINRFAKSKSNKIINIPLCWLKLKLRILIFCKISLIRRSDVT